VALLRELVRPSAPLLLDRLFAIAAIVGGAWDLREEFQGAGARVEPGAADVFARVVAVHVLVRSRLQSCRVRHDTFFWDGVDLHRVGVVIFLWSRLGL